MSTSECNNNSEYIFSEHIKTDDNTATEFDELAQDLDNIMEQIEYVDGITETNRDEIDREIEKEAAAKYNEIMKQVGSEYDPANDPDIAKKPIVKRRVRFDREHIKQLVSQCDLLGFSKQEAVKFINKVLNPEGLTDYPEFTITMYNTWLNKFKEHKVLFFEYYTRSGIFEDVYDTRATIKMVYQHLSRQFRTEVSKGSDKDKRYIIELARTLSDMSDDMMRVSMASPFVAGFQTVMESKNRFIDEVKGKYPYVLKELGYDPTSTKLSVTAKAGSTVNEQSTDAEFSPEGTILAESSETQEGSGNRERNIQESIISRGVPQADRTTGDSSTERIFG